MSLLKVPLFQEILLFEKNGLKIRERILDGLPLSHHPKTIVKLKMPR